MSMFYLDRTCVSAGRDEGSERGGGANNMLAAYLGAEIRHRTTKEAIEFYIKELAKDKPWLRKQLRLVGHGLPGSMETGWGHEFAVMSEYNDIELTWTYPTWAPLFNRLYDLPGFERIEIISCNVGAEESGAKLLWKMAQLTYKRAKAYTGLITIVSQNNVPRYMTFQEGGRWQEASYSMVGPPEPIMAPPHPLIKRKPEKFFQTVEFGKSDKKVLFDSIEELVIDRPAKGGNLRTVFSKSNANALIKELIVSEQVVFQDGDAVSVPGRLTATLTFKSGSHNYVFRVYNDTIAVVENQPTLFFIQKNILNLL